MVGIPAHTSEHHRTEKQSLRIGASDSDVERPKFHYAMGMLVRLESASTPSWPTQTQSSTNRSLVEQPSATRGEEILPKFPTVNGEDSVANESNHSTELARYD